MELLPEDFHPGIVCEQRVQILDLQGECIALNWNPETGKAVAHVENRCMEFQDSNITVREILKYLGYPVSYVDMTYGPHNADNFLDSSLQDMPMSQATLNNKTQTIDMFSLLEMLRAYNDGDSTMYDSISVLADGVLFNELGECVLENHAILFEQGFPVVELNTPWLETGIQTQRGMISF